MWLLSYLYTTDDFHRMNDYIDLEDYDEIEDEEVYDFERDVGPG